MKENKADQNRKYTFNYPWKSVVKGFWTKYPTEQLKFVQFNKVIDMKIIDSNTIQIKRLMYSKNNIPRIHVYSTEDITINLQEKTLDMTTNMIKKSILPPRGIEYCKYSSVIEDGREETLYTKKMVFPNIIANFSLGYYNKFMKTFETGCAIVTEKTKIFEEMKE